MARIPIFDSAATVDSNGDAVSMTLSSSYVASMPVRLFGGGGGDYGGDQRDISYEFVAAFVQSSGVITGDIFWYQEFFNDQPSISSAPSSRTFPDSSAIGGVSCPWAREQNERISSTVITHASITRQYALTMTTGTPWDVRLFPLDVYSLWVRLQISTDAVWTGGAITQALRLRVFAHVGGHQESEYTEALTVPYAYNQF